MCLTPKHECGSCRFKKGNACVVKLHRGTAQYHPEAGSALAWGVMARKDSGRDLLNPLGEENRRVP